MDALKYFLTFTFASRFIDVSLVYTFLGSRAVFYCANTSSYRFGILFLYITHVRIYSSSTSFFFVAPPEVLQKKRKQGGKKIYRLKDQLAYRGVLGPV